MDEGLEEHDFGTCDRCGKSIVRLEDLGYQGAADRESEECSPFMGFETVCAACEGRSVLER